MRDDYAEDIDIQSCYKNDIKTKNNQYSLLSVSGINTQDNPFPKNNCDRELE